MSRPINSWIICHQSDQGRTAISEKPGFLVRLVSHRVHGLQYAFASLRQDPWMVINDPGHSLLGKAQDPGHIIQGGALHLNWRTMPHSLDSRIPGTESTDSPTERASPLRNRGIVRLEREPPDN